MKSIRFNVSALWRSVRLFAAACVCALILFSNALPAYSFPNPFASDKPAQASDPTKGEDKLLGIEEGAQKTAIREQDLLSGKEQLEKANEGPIPVNEVQGSADADKMKSPANSEGETIEGILKDKLEEATGQK
jgi:hypothetical protein